jgi:hypothetical protein
MDRRANSGIYLFQVLCPTVSNIPIHFPNPIGYDLLARRWFFSRPIVVVSTRNVFAMSVNVSSASMRVNASCR